MSFEIYVSADIETSGPIPGRYSMLSLGAVAFDARTFKEIAAFEVNFRPLDGAAMDPRTKSEFWDKFPDAWDYTQQNQHGPTEGMDKFVDWTNSLPGKPVFCAAPLGFDWTFVYFYLEMFAKENPYGFSALCMKSYASALLKTPFRRTVKRNFPPTWRTDTLHPHIAVIDAREQGEIFMEMLKTNGITPEMVDLTRYK